MGFPMNTFQGEGTSRQKILNVISSVRWDFFSNDYFPSWICCNFFRTALFLDELLLHTFSVKLFWHNSYFFKVAISSKQLLFLRSSFFRTTTSPQQLFVQNSNFFRAKLLPRSHFLTIGSSFGQLLFGAATFLAEKKDIYKRATFLK